MEYSAGQHKPNCVGSMAVIDSDLYTAAGRPWGDARYITPLLDDIARQAATADRTPWSPSLSRSSTRRVGPIRSAIASSTRP